MNPSTNPLDGGGVEKHPPEVSQTLQTITAIQNVQTIVQSNASNIQSQQTIVGTSTGLIGKSVSLDLNPKLSLMKPIGQAGNISSTEAAKITTTLCPVGSTVRIISPGMLSTVDRQREQPQQSSQIVSNLPATYHVPRGPAAVANISAPRSTVATPIVRASTGQPVPISRTGPNTTASTAQWPPKTTSIVYAQPQRHVAPPVSRVTRPVTPVYSTQQARLITPPPGRPVQATVVTGVSATPARLVTPVLPTSSTITRLPVTHGRPPTPQVNVAAQSGRPPVQTISTNQTGRPLTTPGTVNRIAVAAPVMSSSSRIATAASVSIQPNVGRQLGISTAASTQSGTVSRIMIPQQQVQQQQHQPQQCPPRVVQTVTSLPNHGAVTRVITTAANVTGAPRPTQQNPAPVARISGSVMSLHPLPLASTRVTPAIVKPTQSTTMPQTVQLKTPTQQPGLRISTSTPNTGTGTGTTHSVQGSYPQYRQTSIQPVRLLVDPSYEEPHAKPNASPRPSILRKRDHDISPVKSAAKNLVPVLASLPPVIQAASPPGSPRGDRDPGGCQSSGSTTVSATSSPGLDEEPEQSRITINPTVEMSPRKKPRKQQLTGVELTEPRCTEEEMQFISEEKIKKEIKTEIKDKTNHEKKQAPNNPQDHPFNMQQQTSIPVRSRPTPSLLGSSWKNRWDGRLHHYRRPSDVRPREERRPTVAELAQQKHVLQKLNGWKVYHLTTQMEDLADLEKQVHEKLKSTLAMLESQQGGRGRQEEALERANELIKGNMQRSSLISEGMNEARTQLVAIFQHKGHVTEILQRCGNKRTHKKRDK
ncbi:histone deacetylase complex subunit SAP130 isoform X2 [Athalia rosae]|uniref:histone deacetylase complex subunit SAP130 isoform X2 n=1 Tax=Athalia rosae TaxID=37344 RepID=UPI000626D3BB|nr:histone deacetylase complex subunit SAP130 isoform X2 [Athalia rosae]